MNFQSLLFVVGLAVSSSCHPLATATVPLRRWLALGDFSALNELFQGASVDIPGEFSTDAASGVLISRTLHIRDISCTDLRIGDLLVEATSSDDIVAGSPPPDDLPVVTSLAVDVVDLDLDCNATYFLDKAFDDQRGSFRLRSRGSTVQTEFALESARDQVSVTASTTACSANVEIGDVDFDNNDSVVGDILDFAEPLMSLMNGPIKTALATTVCQEMESVGSTALPQLLNQLTERINPYIQPLEDVVLDPLQPQREFERSQNVSGGEATTTGPYVNFLNADDKASDPASDLTRFVLDGLDEMNAWLGSTVVVTTPGGPPNDLAVNLFLRETVLDSTGAFVWKGDESPENSTVAEKSDKSEAAAPKGLILLESHNDLLQVVLTLNGIVVRGLDSMTNIDTLQRIGNQTLQNTLGWKSLSGIADIGIRIAPSTLNTSLWSETKPGMQLLEKVQLQLQADDIQAVLSIFAAIHQDRLGQVPLGALFHSKQIPTCLLSTLYPSQLISGLSVQVSNLVDPTIGGFTSPGLDRVLTEAMDLMYNLYEHWLVEGLPNFAQTTLRDSVNDMWIKAIEGLTTQDACPLVDPPVQEGKIPYVDFRDWLLPPDKAQAMGGSGQEPYGDVVSKVFGILTDQIMAVDEGDPQKRLMLNQMILDPLTAKQSGEEGTLHFSSSLISFAMGKAGEEKRNGSSIVEEIAAALFDSMELQIFNATVRNMNTVVEPTVLLMTTESNPHLLKNMLHMGPIPAQPLNVSLLIRVAVDALDKGGRRLTDDSATIEHIMELSMSASSLRVQADIMARVNAQKLQEFHLQDVFNLHCWLATVEQTEIPWGIKMDTFWTEIRDLAMGIQCVNDECSKAGLGVLSELSKIWEESNVTTTLGERFELLAAELLTGDYVHNQVARWVDEAPTKCPHNKLYNAKPQQDLALEKQPEERQPNATSSLAPLEFSALSIDTMIFTAMAGAQAGLLLMSEVDPGMLGLPTSVLTATNPLSSEQYIDFTTKGGIESLADLVNYLLQRASELLRVSEPGQSTGVNSIVRGMLNLEGFLDVEFPHGPVYEDSHLQLRLDRISLGGLDSFSQFEVLVAEAPQLLQNNIKLESLSVDIDASVISGGNSQRVTISFRVEDFAASIPMYAAINAKKVDALELGSLLEIENVLSCIFTAFDDMHFPSFDLSIGNLTNFSVKGLLPVTGDAFDRSMLAIQKFSVGMDGMLNSVIQGVLNGILSPLRKNAVCQNVMLQSSGRRAQESTSFIDFRDLFLSPEKSLVYGGSGQSPYGDVLRTVLGLVEALVLDTDPETGVAAVNEMVIAPLTEAISYQRGTVFMPGDVIDVGNRISVGGLNANFTFRASDFRIDNLDTIRSPIALLAPVKGEPFLLNNTATAGLPDKRPLSTSARILLGLEDNGDINLRNDFVITMDMQEASVVLTAFMKMMQDQLATFPMRDILNLNCWLATMPASPLDEYGFRDASELPSATLSQLAASVSRLALRTECMSCTSEGLADWSTEGSKDIELVTDRIVNYATRILAGNFVQVQIDRAINNAARRCPHSPDYDPDFLPPTYSAFESEVDSPSTTFLLMLLMVTTLLLLTLGLITVGVRCVVRMRHRRLLKSLPNRQLYLLQKEQEKQSKRQGQLNAVTRSLFQSSATIPAIVRYTMPLVILSNIAFFLSGHLSLGATVNIEMRLAGQSIRVEEFFSFSIATSTIDIWNAGGKALAALIFIFSGLWPYTKQIITLVLWFTPPTRLSMARRESILLWLDTLGKWSMVDIFVLLVSLAGFRVSIESPNLDFLPDNFYSLDLMVVPVWGLYANMIAQIISQISSHFIIHYHRKVVAHASRAYRALFRNTAALLARDVEETTEGYLDERSRASLSTSSESENTEDAVRKDKLCEHAFVRPHSNNSKLVARGYVNPVLCCIAFCMSVLLLVGCILPSFSLQIMGIMGVLVESGNDWKQAVENHSVFTITQMLMDQARFLGGVGNYLGLGTLSAVLVLTVLIVPLVLTVALLCHWFVPMNKQTRRRMEVFIEALHAWEYVEVYLVATVVAIWQLGPMSEFMINAYCEDLDETFDMLVYYGILSPGDAQCFRVEASIESASYMLAASAVLLALLNTYIGNASRQYFRDIENKSRNELVPPCATGLETCETNIDDNVSAMSSPGDSKVHAFALVEYRGEQDEISCAGSDKDERLPLAEECISTKLSEESEDEKVVADPLAKPASNEDNEESWRRSDAMEMIHPVPVLFTDKFRWTLRSQEHNAVTDPMLPIKEDPYIGDYNMDPSESQTLLSAGESFLLKEHPHPYILSGDAPSSIPPTPEPSTLDGASTRDGSSIAEIEDDFSNLEIFGDEVGYPYGSEKGRSLGQADWETESEDGSHNLFSRGETVDMSLSTDQVESVAGTERSFNSRTSESFLLGSASVRLEPGRRSQEPFEDEMGYITDEDDINQSTRLLRSELREAEDAWRRDNSHSSARTGNHSGSTRPRSNTTTSPRGNSHLQAAFLEDVEL